MGDIVVPYGVLDLLALDPSEETVFIMQELLLSQRRMEGDKYTGYPLRYASACSLVDHLLRWPDHARLINSDILAKAATHDDQRLAGPALIVIGLSGVSKYSVLQSVLLAKQTTVTRAILLLVAAEKAGYKLPDSVSHKVPLNHPVHKVLCWASENPNLEEKEWSSLLENHTNVANWVGSIQTQYEDVNGALRYLLSTLFDKNLSHFNATDRRKNELAEVIEVMTMRSLFGE